MPTGEHWQKQHWRIKRLGKQRVRGFFQLMKTKGIHVTFQDLDTTNEDDESNLVIGAELKKIQI